ncbi:MAG: N-6 DNA methylase [Selenomonadaceae bacterium]|nr:N-6 DNA methylase [Selenomonadaceae bacterium]
MIDAKKFVKKWSERGYEKGEAQPFWLSFLRDVFDIAEPENFISFEVPIPHGFIDGLIDSTKVLIEQKSSTVNLDDPEIFRQAKRYNDALEYSRKARWIVTCNFREFRVFDMDNRYPEREPLKISLFELPKKFSALNFLVEFKDNISYERELSIQASAIVAKIYDGLRGELKIQTDDALSDLNKLCVRLVFCLYAESINIFGKHKIFRDYLRGARNIRQDLLELFKVLDTPLENRSPYLDDTLKKFPYVDGGLFADEIDFPNFTPEIKTLLLDDASSNFKWEDISPTIFGTVFESTLNTNDETQRDIRRTGGMHYTSTENIHKVINPLFMDDLRAEFDTIKKSTRNRRKNLFALQDKIASLKFLDPAAGSGNFLTETYIQLRRLENEILKELLENKIILGDIEDPIKVSIKNFYGIEINNFAVAVAQTALWIAEIKMKRETEEIVHKGLDIFPLKTEAHILEANALHVDWKSFAPEVNYIISNPPFVGASMMDAVQKSDAVKIFGKIKLSNSIDYVGAWYHKAAQLMAGTNIKAAFVSTNSITQGEQVTPLWRKLFDDYGMQIIFGRRTFKWDSESFHKAAIHCVVIGMCDKNLPVDKKIFDGDKIFPATNINPYLVDAPIIFIDSRARHYQDFVPRMTNGSQATDDGNFIFSEDEAKKFIKKFPAQAHLIHRYVGAKDFLNGEPIRYCLWLFNVPPNEYSRNREIMKRLEAIKIFRENSSAAPTRKSAETPYKFFSTTQPSEIYLAMPRTSSERRLYLPLKFLTPEIICNCDICIIPGAEIYHFGILTSSIHMAWMRAVAGRLKSDYRYSGSVVYNNFPWCLPTLEQKKLIEQTAQKILDVRANYPDATLADLYDELTMPQDLRLAHKKNDRAVAAAYGFENFLDDESKIVAELMKLYERFTNK